MIKITIDKETNLITLQEKDSETLFSLVDKNRNHLREWLPWLDNNTKPEHSREFIIDSLKSYEEKKSLQLGIWHKNNLAGVIGLHKIDYDNKFTQIGYWIGSEYQGKGLMTKACKSLCDYVLNDLELNKIEIRCAVENKKSRAIPERLGFKLENEIIEQAEFLYDKFVDHAVYIYLKVNK